MRPPQKNLQTNAAVSFTWKVEGQAESVVPILLYNMRKVRDRQFKN